MSSSAINGGTGLKARTRSVRVLVEGNNWAQGYFGSSDFVSKTLSRLSSGS